MMDAFSQKATQARAGSYVAPRLKSLAQQYLVVITIWLAIAKYPHLK
jgi:hypothetical protein